MFPVKDIERRQTNVGDVLLNQSDFGMCHCVPRRYIHCGPTGSCGRVAHQRQRHPRNAQDRRDLPPTLSFRNVLDTRHGKVLSHARGMFQRTRRAHFKYRGVGISLQGIESKTEFDVYSPHQSMRTAKFER